jgi:TetR/AcrR family transcriptional repressor of bet genes
MTMPGRKAPEAARREQILEAAYRVALRRRLAGLTIRDVAREARLSSGLVLFHFKTKDELMSALLEWTLRSGTVLQPVRRRSDEPDATSLCALVRAEASRLSSDRLRAELFFDFWVAGTRTARLRSQMRRALTNYRKEFRSLAARALRQRPCPATTPGGLAAAAVSFIQGCAIQAVIDPRAFDLPSTLAVLDMLAEGHSETLTRLRSLDAGEAAGATRRRNSREGVPRRSSSR